MRLSLLARKLNVKPSEIIDYLDLEGHKAHGNSKLTEDNINKVLEEYGPLPLEEEESIEAKEVPIVSEDLNEVTSIENASPELDIEPDAKARDTMEFRDPVIEDSPPPKEEKTPKEPDFPELTPNISSTETAPHEPVILEVADLLESEEEIDTQGQEVLIKAPKVFLPGLSVKGKIDLPEPKPKEVKTEEADKAIEADRGKRRQKRKDFNPIAAKRRREERAEEKRKKALQKKEKEKKRRHYENKAVLPPIKPKKIKKKETKAIAQAPKNIRRENAKPLNALQKFWRWMNT